MLPVPTVADNAVIKDSNDEISPSSLSSDFLNNTLKPCLRFLIG